MDGPMVAAPGLNGSEYSYSLFIAGLNGQKRASNGWSVRGRDYEEPWRWSGDRRTQPAATRSRALL